MASGPWRERRRHPRKECRIRVDCITDSEFFEGLFTEMSSSGAFVHTAKSACKGQEIEMIFSHPISRYDLAVIGQVVWSNAEGFGVKFRRLVWRGERLNLRSSEEEGPKELREVAKEPLRGKIKRKKICWHQSNSPNIVKYRLYWSEDGLINYDSKHVDLGNVTEVVLPEGITLFPLIRGPITIGISAVNEVGKESDIRVIRTDLNFVPPDPPRRIEVDYLSA